jgi:hypothetical protein
MAQVLLGQATVGPDVLQKLEELHFHLVVDRIAVHSVAAVVAAACFLLLIRTSATTLNSRFLRHLAVSIGLIVAYRLGSIVDLLLNAGLAFLSAGVSPKDPAAGSLSQVLATLQSTWHGIDITISLLTSFFLFTTWSLLRGYPNENVNRSLFTLLTGAFGVPILAMLVSLLQIAVQFQPPIWLVLDILDVSAATIGLWLVGWQLRKTLGPKMHTNNAVWKEILPLATALSYLLWGGLQPFYYWPLDSSWYSILLSIAGLCAIILTVMLCAQSLENRPEYGAAQPVVSAAPEVAPG